MEQSKLLINARQIASHIVSGNLKQAESMFDKSCADLKYFEATILRDKIHAAVKELEAEK